MIGKQQAGGGAAAARAAGAAGAAGAAEGVRLKLRAHDAEDLRALAACLQDALVPLTDVAYMKAEKRFVMVANRFMWEHGIQDAPGPERVAASTDEAGDEDVTGAGAGDGDPNGDARFDDAETRPLYHRVNCAVYFDRVHNVRFRGLDPYEKDQMLSLLTVEAEPGAILLVFSGGAAIRLEVRDVRCHLEDLGEPWPTRWRPDHDELEAT